MKAEHSHDGQEGVIQGNSKKADPGGRTWVGDSLGAPGKG